MTTLPNNSNITKRSVKSAPLSHVDLDNNFQELKNVIDLANSSRETLGVHTTKLAVIPSPEELSTIVSRVDAIDNLVPGILTNTNAIAALTDRVIVLERYHGDVITPRLTISASVSQLNETDNSTVEFTFNCVDFQADDTQSYSISGIGITSSDFVGSPPLSGVLGTGNSNKTLSLTIAKDRETEAATETMIITVNSNSVSPSWQSVSKSITISDTSYNSEMRTLNFTPSDPPVDNEFFDFIVASNPPLTGWITNIADGYIITPQETGVAIDEAIATVSRAPLVGLGFTNDQINDIITTSINEIVDLWNTNIGNYFSGDSVIAHDGVARLVDSIEDDQHGTIATHGGVTYRRTNLRHENIVYVESYNIEQLQSNIDTALESIPELAQLTAEQRGIIRDFVVLCIEISLALLVHTKTTVSLYDYEVIQEL